MPVLRHTNRDTGTNESAIIQVLKDTNTKKVTFFATPTDSDPADPNLPLMAALVKYEIPGIGPVQIVFDGDFLTAARRPRYLEVKNVLDHATKCGKAHFSSERIQFTSELSPEEAAREMQNLGKLEQLTEGTRKRYFSLLSNVPEDRYP